MKSASLKSYSIEEYQAIEEETGIKHEYHDGNVWAMSGGTINHGILCGNIFSELRNALDRDTCQAYLSEIKLSIEATNSFVYPDAMVVCGDLEKSEKNPHAICNPTVIVEVLSKSTALYDRGDKFFLYRQIPSLREYILIEQDKYQVESFFQKDNNVWQISRTTGVDSILKVSSLDIDISMSDLYENIDLSKQQALIN